MMDSAQLLRDYIDKGNEFAFSVLVGNYVSLVYSTALRRAGGNDALARDIVQTVFTDLAQKASGLPADVQLGGWLHHHTCYVASNHLRSERRRQTREQVAAAMNLSPDSPDQSWQELAPALDEAIDSLEPQDRSAIILRFFEQRDFQSVGAVLGVSDDAAQKRVSRALERLREWLVKREVTLSVVGLGTLLGARAVSAAPMGLAATVARTALTSVASQGLLHWLFSGLRTGKAALGIAVAVVLILGGVYFAKPKAASSKVEQGVTQNAAAAQSVPPPPVGTAAAGSTTAQDAAGMTNLVLTIVTADSGRPVPNVPIECNFKMGDDLVRKKFMSDRVGNCTILYPTVGLKSLEMTSRIDGFADTRLHWIVENGEVVPEAYTLRLIRGATIGGTVVDAKGKPIAKAEVGFNHQENAVKEAGNEDHYFGWITALTDESGHWSITRIAPDEVFNIQGFAKHTDHIPSSLLVVSEHPETEQPLRDKTYVFRLGTGLAVRGNVVDAQGLPISGAKVLVGLLDYTSSRNSVTSEDGSFAVSGCTSGKTLLTAEATGFAVTTIMAEITPRSDPFKIVLRPGRTMHFRVINQDGEPVPDAGVWLETNLGTELSPVPQTHFGLKTDLDGRMEWNNAPTGDLSFTVSAKGYMDLHFFKTHAGEGENVITLDSAVVVSGTVVDAETGAPVPRFRFVGGRPNEGELYNRVGRPPLPPIWSSFQRHWDTFTDGKFRFKFNEPMIVGTTNPGYVFRIEADGYTPYISRAIAPNEREVHFEIVLKKSVSLPLTVLRPDGSRAAYAEIAAAIGDEALVVLLGKFVRTPTQSSDAITSADGSGFVKIRLDDALIAVAAIHKDGFAWLERAQLMEAKEIWLEAWGRIEGTWAQDGEPVRSGELIASIAQSITHHGRLHLDDSVYSITTDSEGHFQFPNLMPGRYRLFDWRGKRIPLPTHHGVMTFGGLKPIAEVEIHPGETTTANFGQK